MSDNVEQKEQAMNAFVEMPLDKMVQNDLSPQSCNAQKVQPSPKSVFYYDPRAEEVCKKIDDLSIKFVDAMLTGPDHPLWKVVPAGDRVEMLKMIMENNALRMKFDWARYRFYNPNEVASPQQPLVQIGFANIDPEAVKGIPTYE